jgi:hypothetical protein
MIGEQKFVSLADAIAAAKAGDTITLLANGLDLGDISKNVTVLKGDLTVNSVGTITAGTYDWEVKADESCYVKDNKDGT